MTAALHDSLLDWTPRPRPQRTELAGRYVRLAPLSPTAHGDDLFEAFMGHGAAERFRWMAEAPMDRPAFQRWLDGAAVSEDPLFHAVIDKAAGRAGGRQALMRIDPAHGVIEIGSIVWGDAIARTRMATEAVFLTARHVFETLGYRRFEWKCNADNAPSRRAALRFGFVFEGIFRQHMVVKGHNRDTAWFAMLDRDWPALKARYEAWLDPANFDHDGRQRTPLRVSL